MSLMITAAVGALIPGCGPLRQPLGSLEQQGVDGSTEPGTIISTQTPDLPPEWGNCNPTVFRCFQDPAVPVSPPASGLFSGVPDPDPASKPIVVYPLAGSTHPINLADITFQWRRGPGVAQTVFRIRLQRGNGDRFEFYVPCKPTGAPRPPVPTECVYQLPPGAWLETAVRARGEVVTVDVAGVDPTRPGMVATSDALTLSFSPESITGGLYYWANSLPGTMRLLFGARKKQPFIAPETLANPTSCSGCHTVSRDGAVIAFTEGDSAIGVLSVAGTADPTKPLFVPSDTHDSGTMALNHDGSRVLVSFSGRLILRDTATGATLGSEVGETLLGPRMHGFHPEWSPDDSSIALTVSADGDSDWAVRTGAIGVIPYNSGAFGPVEVLVPSGTEFNFYPTWSPDGHWLAFATAPVGGAQTSYNQVNARLRLVNRNTREVFELTNATFKLGHTSTWPKFAPVPQSGGLIFLTFNSKIDYGFFLPNNAGGSPQLWMTAIDVRKLPAGDASSPPVWLPFQDVMVRNYLGCWSERIGCRVDTAGRSIGCGESEICTNGSCAMVAR